MIHCLLPASVHALYATAAGKITNSFRHTYYIMECLAGPYIGTTLNYEYM